MTITVNPDKLKVLLKPNWWFRNNGTNSAWDMTLTDILRSGQFDFEDYDNYNFTLIDKKNNRRYRIWNENYPYAWGTFKNLYASRSTSIWLKDEVDKWLIEQVRKGGRIV